MALKPIIESLDAVPEALRSEYEAKDGKFVLKLDGELPEVVALKSKVNEFRTSNRTMKEQLDALNEKAEALKDIDPEAARKALAKVKELEEKGVKGSDDVTEIVAKAIGEYDKTKVTPLRKQLSESTEREQKAQEKLKETRLRQAATELATKMNAEADAIDFLVGEFAKAFEVKDDEVVAKDGKHAPDDVDKPLTPEQWIAQEVKNHKFAFQKSSGGGAPAGGTTTSRDGKTIINPTPEVLGRLAAREKDPFKEGVRIQHTR